MSAATAPARCSAAVIARARPWPSGRGWQGWYASPLRPQPAIRARGGARRAPGPRGPSRLDDDGPDAVAEQQPAPSGAERAHLAVAGEHAAGVEQGELVGFHEVTARDGDAGGAGRAGGRAAPRVGVRVPPPPAPRRVAAEVLLRQAAGVGYRAG